MTDIASKIESRVRQAIGPDVLADAVRGVMGQHRPGPLKDGTDDGCRLCREATARRRRCLGCSSVDGDANLWPCPTVRAVASALGVREDGEG